MTIKKNKTTINMFLTQVDSLRCVFEHDKKTPSYERIKADEKLQKKLKANSLPTTTFRDNDDELNKRFELILNEGKLVPYVSPAVDTSQMPSYFDRKRMLEAQESAELFYGCLGLSTMTGMMIALQLTEVLMPLLKTGRSRTIPDLMTRTVAAIKYSSAVYETPFFDQRDPSTNQMIEGWKSVLLVRGMHERAFKMVNNKTCKEAQFEAEKCVASGEPRKHLWMNQYDMALMQFCFVGLFCVDPKRVGAHFKSREQYEKVVSNICYFWRVFCYCLGQEDRFNIFQYCDSFEKQHNFLLAMFNHIKFKLNDERKMPIAPKVGEGLYLAMARLVLVINFNVVDHWWHGTGLSFTGAPLRRCSPIDCAKSSALYFATQCAMSNQRLLPFINRQMRANFERFESNQENIKKALTKTHADTVHELEPDFKFTS